MSEHYYAVIMAGGGGTRLWPLSRKARPKQMLQLVGDETLFQAAVHRLKGLLPPERILVVTAADQAPELRAQCPELPEENFVLEPLPRGTASAIGLTAVVLQKRDPQAVMSVLTADHFIADPTLFRRILVAAHDVAQDDYLVTLGIHPTYPATGYGYIQQGEKIGTYDGFEVFKALRFREKPDRETAEQMLASADHAWNSGMFMWRVDRVMAEFERQMPELFAALTEIAVAWDTSEQDVTLGRIWPQIKPETIDYGIMENAQQVAVIPAEGLGWNDLGSWESFFDMLPTNEDGNIVHCEHHINLDTRDSMVYADCDDRLIVTIGVKDLVIVDTGDVLMVCAKDHAQDVREAIKHLKEKDQTEYL